MLQSQLIEFRFAWDKMGHFISPTISTWTAAVIPINPLGETNLFAGFAEWLVEWKSAQFFAEKKIAGG